MKFHQKTFILLVLTLLSGCVSNQRDALERLDTGAARSTETTSADAQATRARPVREFLPRGARLASGRYYLFFLAGTQWQGSPKVDAAMRAICSFTAGSSSATDTQSITRVITPVAEAVDSDTPVGAIEYDFDRASLWLDALADAAGARTGLSSADLGPGSLGFIGTRRNILSLLEAGESSPPLETSVIRSEFIYTDLLEIDQNLLGPIINRLLNRTRESHVVDNETYYRALRVFSDLARIGRVIIHLKGDSSAFASEINTNNQEICGAQR